MSSKIPSTITFKRPGTAPPLFLAGSFSDPEWEPKEMEYRTENDGEHTFQSEVMIRPGEDYQFKLRMGEGSWWILAENYPVATDDSGNQNNVLNVPKPVSDEQAVPNDINDPLTNDRAGDPPPPNPKTRVYIPEPDTNSKDVADELKTPLFAHECLGAYDFEDEESEEEACPGVPPKSDVNLKSDDHSPVNVDLNDPTIEKFPSDRTSILDALRTIQTHLDEDKPHLDDTQSSPRAVSSNRPNIDTADEMSLSPNSTRTREHRLSHSSFGRSRSVVSLGSIAEEPKPDAIDLRGPPVISLPNPNTASVLEEPRSPPSEEDEAVAMKSSEEIPKDNVSKMLPSQDISKESVPDKERMELAATSNVVPVQVADANSQLKGDQTNSRSVPLGQESGDNTVSTRVDTSSGATLKDKAKAAVLERSSRQEVIHGHNPAETWIPGLLNSMSANKLPIVLTGAVALAVGIRWWNGSDK